MTPKERAAMQQALEALVGMQHGTDWNNGTHAKIYRPKFPAAITALREALANSLKPRCFADYQPNHAIDRACASCAIADECRTGEQPVSQEPVARVTGYYSGRCVIEPLNRATVLPTDMALYAAPVQQAEQEPVGRWNWNEAKFEWLTKFNYYKHHMTPLYTAPVRTKDLTDGEIWEIVDNTKPLALDFARAVIAADREKNK